MERRKSFKAVRVEFAKTDYVNENAVKRLKELHAPQFLIDNEERPKNRIMLVGNAIAELGLVTVSNETGYTHAEGELMIKYISFKGNNPPALLISALNNLKEQAVIDLYFMGTIQINKTIGKWEFIPNL